MKILLSSHAFSPSVGGIETVSAILAREWSMQGHSVGIVTQTPGEVRWESLPVLRKPSFLNLRHQISGADLYFQNHISLRSLLPAVGLSTKVAVLHQTYLWPWNRRAGLAGLAKKFVARRLRNLAISSAVASALPPDTPVVGNPYDAGTFRIYPDVTRTREFLFVGRFVSDKGIELLLRSLCSLHKQGGASARAALTLVGSGPEEQTLRQRVTEYGLTDSVTFAGPLAGDALAREYNAHRILVVPSIWPEPFGIVALEGAACGCLVVGSSAGGLSEAVGPAGLTFPNGDVGALSRAMGAALQENPSFGPSIRAHLSRFEPRAFARRVLELAISAA